MAFHKTNLGSFGVGLKSDMNGFVLEATDGPWDFVIDHGTERTHNENGGLTEYGEWWEEEGFPEWRDAAVEATAQSTEALSKWQRENV